MLAWVDDKHAWSLRLRRGFTKSLFKGAIQTYESYPAAPTCLNKQWHAGQYAFASRAQPLWNKTELKYLSYIKIHIETVCSYSCIVYIVSFCNRWTATHPSGALQALCPVNCVVTYALCHVTAVVGGYHQLQLRDDSTGVLGTGWIDLYEVLTLELAHPCLVFVEPFYQSFRLRQWLLDAVRSFRSFVSIFGRAAIFVFVGRHSLCWAGFHRNQQRCLVCQEKSGLWPRAMQLLGHLGVLQISVLRWVLCPSFYWDWDWTRPKLTMQSQ